MVCPPATEGRGELVRILSRRIVHVSRSAGRCVRWGGHPPGCSHGGGGGQHRSGPGNSPLRGRHGRLSATGRLVEVTRSSGPGRYRGHRQLRRRSGPLSNRGRCQGDRGEPSQPAVAPPVGQDRRHRRPRSGTGGSQRTGHCGCPKAATVGWKQYGCFRWPAVRRPKPAPRP